MDCYPNEEGPEFDECYALAFGVPAALMLVALGKHSNSFFLLVDLHNVNMVCVDQQPTSSDGKVTHKN